MPRFPKHFGYTEEDHAALVRIHKLVTKTIDNHGRVRNNKEGRHLSSILNRLPKRSLKSLQKGVLTASNLPFMEMKEGVETVETSSKARTLWYSSKSGSCYRIGIRDSKCVGFLLFYKFVYACTDGRVFVGDWELGGVCFSVNPCDWV